MNKRQYGEYDAPSRGDGDWGTALNDTFETVAADVTALARRLDELESGGGGDGGGEIPSLLQSEKGVTVVSPGNLESAVEDMPDGGDPRPVQYSMVKLRAGETYRPSSPIDLDDGQQIHAYGATIEPQHDGPTFRFSREAMVYGGTVDLGDTGGTACRIVGSRMGFPKGPQGTRVVATPGSGARGLVVDSDEIRTGRGSMALETDGVDEPVYVDIRENGTVFFNSIPVFLRARDYEVAVQVYGDDAVNANHWVLDLAPSNRSEAAVVVDSTDFSENLFEGRIRDPERHDTVVRIERSSLNDYELAKNTFATYSGRTFDSPPEWVDRTPDRSSRHDESRNRTIDFSAASFEYRQRSPAVPDGDVLLADGSDFEATLQEAASRGANVRVESGTTLNGAGVTIPETVAVDARGARIELKTRYSDDSGGLSFEAGALLIGGRIYARMDEDEAALTVRADGETVERPTGPVRPVLQCKRDCTGLLVEAVNGGRITNLNNRIMTLAARRAYDIRADASSEVVDNRLKLGAVNAIEYNLKTHGQGTVANNDIGAHLHATDTAAMEAIWVIDGPDVRDNTVDGWFWDTGRWGITTTRVVESGGNNVYVNLFNQEYPKALSRTRPPQDVRRQNRQDDPDNDAGSDYREIGYNTIDAEPDLLRRAAADRLTTESFSPLPFESDVDG